MKLAPRARAARAVLARALRYWRHGALARAFVANRSASREKIFVYVHQTLVKNNTLRETRTEAFDEMVDGLDLTEEQGQILTRQEKQELLHTVHDQSSDGKDQQPAAAHLRDLVQEV